MGCTRASSEVVAAGMPPAMGQGSLPLGLHLSMEAVGSVTEVMHTAMVHSVVRYSAMRL